MPSASSVSSLGSIAIDQLPQKILAWEDATGQVYLSIDCHRLLQPLARTSCSAPVIAAILARKTVAQGAAPTKAAASPGWVLRSFHSTP